MILFSFLSFIKLALKERFDVLHSHWLLPNGFVGALVSKLTGIPLVISLHGSGVFVAEKNFLYRLLGRYAAKQAALVTSCSSDMKTRLTRFGCPPEKIVLLPYGVDIEHFRPNENTRMALQLRRRFEIAQHDIVIMALGRLVYKKGFEYLLRAIPHLNKRAAKVKVIIAGGGDLEASLKALANKLNISHQVIFTGVVSRDKIPAYFAMCDIFVVPSIRDKNGNIDGLPNVILEAMASGKPVVASDIAGIGLVIKDEVTGLLTPEKDAVKIALAIQKLIDSPGLRRQLSEAARRKVELELTWNNIAQQLMKIFKRITSYELNWRSFKQHAPGR